MSEVDNKKVDNKKNEINDDRVKIINDKLNSLTKNVDNCDSIVPMEIAEHLCLLQTFSMILKKK